MGRRKLFTTGFQEAFSAPEKASGVADQLAKDMARINAELREALQAEGYPADYLEPIYRCPACRDTGYVGEPVRERCVCLRQKLMDRANRNERKGGLGKHSFAQFDEAVFPDEPLQGRSDTQRVRKLCERYAEDFPETTKANLLFTGPPGLGKTFIADCIAQCVMERAFLVRRITSYRMVEIMRKHHFDSSEAATVDDLMTCDLLFIDDLGAEPMIRNVTVGYLFQIINERNNDARHTIISTNLSPAELIETYTERVTSRMLDTDRTLVLRFYGRDLRLQRRGPA